MEQPALIDRDHPSFGTAKAAFMFALTDPRTGALNRFILVEANNAWAVQTIERILLADQKASDNCRCLGVYRNPTSVGTRDDMLEEVSFVDFMLDIVDPARLLGSPLVSTGFNRALTAEEREYAKGKIDAEARMAQSVRAVPVAVAKPVAPKPVPKAAPKPAVDAEQLVSALCGLGFKKPAVVKFVDSARDRLATDTIAALIKDGCKALAA